MPRHYRMLVAFFVLLPALTLLAPLPSVRAAGPAFQLSPTDIDFGDEQVGAGSAHKIVTLTNTGDAPLLLRGFAVGRDFRLRRSTPGCQFEPSSPAIPPGGSCTFRLVFRPTAQGRVVDAFRIESNATRSDDFMFLIGNGVVPPGVPSLSLDSYVLNFPLRAVGMASAPQTVTLTNLGDVELGIRSMSIVGQNAGDFAQTNTCGASLAAGASCTVDVTFAPTATGDRFRTLAIDDTAAGSPHFVQLSGRTTVPEACNTRTDTCIDPLFRTYWILRGGLPINGYPISELILEKLEDGKFYRVQYFERVRMEYHWNEPDPNYQVQLGQFGRRILADVPDAPTAPAARKDGYTFFEETGNNVRPEFAAYWEANGGLDQFGYPLSEEFQQQLEDGQTYTVQYFERARFELHLENQPPFNVELGQFGRRICGSSCR